GSCCSHFSRRFDRCHRRCLLFAALLCLSMAPAAIFRGSHLRAPRFWRFYRFLGNRLFWRGLLSWLSYTCGLLCGLHVSFLPFIRSSKNLRWCVTILAFFCRRLHRCNRYRCRGNT